MNRRTAALLVVTALLGLGVGPSAAAAPRPVAEVEILPTAHLANDGAAIIARVRTICQPNGILWEGFIGAVQNDAGSFVGLPLVCDGRVHVSDVALSVDVSDPRFTRGEATLHASILDEDTLDLYDTDTRTVKVH